MVDPFDYLSGPRYDRLVEHTSSSTGAVAISSSSDLVLLATLILVSCLSTQDMFPQSQVAFLDSSNPSTTVVRRSGEDVETCDR